MRRGIGPIAMIAGAVMPRSTRSSRDGTAGGRVTGAIIARGARNAIPATVTAIERGDVTVQVEVDPVGTSDRTASVTTADSLEELGIKEGDTVLAEPASVLLVKPWRRPGDRSPDPAAPRRVGHPAVIGPA